MGSGAMIYVPSFIGTGSAIQRLLGGDADTQNKQSILKIVLSRI
jgi:hypothetical protein